LAAKDLEISKLSLERQQLQEKIRGFKEKTSVAKRNYMDTSNTVSQDIQDAKKDLEALKVMEDDSKEGAANKAPARWPEVGPPGHRLLRALGVLLSAVRRHVFLPKV